MLNTGTQLGLLWCTRHLVLVLHHLPRLLL